MTRHYPTDMMESTAGGGARKVGTQCVRCLTTWPCEVSVWEDRAGRATRELLGLVALEPPTHTRDMVEQAIDILAGKS